MSGPAIRYWHIAHALALELEVTLAVPAPATISSPQVQIVEYEPQDHRRLRQCARQADVILCAGGFLLYHYPFLQNLTQPMVMDLYAPIILETLEMHTVRPLAAQTGIHRLILHALRLQLARGDFFLCANEQQRLFWLGWLAAEGRVNPYTFSADRALRQLIAVVPFGLPVEPPVRQQPVLKGVQPGIAKEDKVIYWGGGLWEWFDPLTAIRAMAEITAQRSDIKLFFAGVNHPNPEVPAMQMTETAQRLSAELGLTGRSVFFNEWVPYAERANYLLEADVGLSLHFGHVETQLAYRTRLLDYIWAGLPMVISSGDSLGAQAEAVGLARTVHPGDIHGVKEALLAFINGPVARAAFIERARPLADALHWPEVIKPILEFCRHPQRAADHPRTLALTGIDPTLVANAWQRLRRRGVSQFLKDARIYLNFHR